MLAPFFRIGMMAPGRQIAFRRVTTFHVIILAILAALALRPGSGPSLGVIAQLLLSLGLVEGAALIGWRLTQLPKSQALEFLLVSPVRPRRVYLAEALVGIGRFALVNLAGLPVLCLYVFAGLADWSDLAPLALMPFLWGVIAGLGLTAWVYEPIRVRRIGEILGLLGLLVYLIVGVVAGENLRLWLTQLPDWLGRFLFDSVMFLHTMNPFGVVRYWFAPEKADWLAWERFTELHLFGGLLALVFAVRGAWRLQGHFHDRHYRPIDSSRATQLELIGDRPLSWWAVRRVMEYSGRVNLWLAGGFALVYAAFIMAGDAWPPWMGRLVFFLFETCGGAPLVATALTVMAAVPAAYQFGLWDATVQDRCRRLELLLLSELSGKDYAHAAYSAAWTRGRGYLLGAGFLWIALAVSGRIAWWDALAAGVGGLVLWAFAFAVGFRGFATGHQTNGIASLLTLGLPMVLYGLWQAGWHTAAAFVPTAVTFIPLKTGVTFAWAAGLFVTGGIALVMIWQGVRNCDANLRRWYDTHQGQRSVE